MTVFEWVQFSVLTAGIVLSIAASIMILVKATKEGFTRKRTATLVLVLGLLFITYLAYNIQKIEPADHVQIMLLLGLVLVTGIYADANVRMAKEMREQRIMASRPVIIQKTVAVSETELGIFGADWFSHFEVYNAGNGPAIEVEISLLNEDKSLRQSHRESFLRAGETPLEFSPTGLVDLQGITFYLVTEYQSILSRQAQHIWYQTWLPFKLSKATKEGKVYVVAGELEFKEVVDKECIDAFGSRSKPK